MPGTAAALCCDSGDGPVTVGCGLTGDGSGATPLAVAPAAGQEPWPWTCDAADASTLKCDPDTGQLWTPPEHNAFVFRWSSTFTAFVGNPFGPTGGWTDLSSAVGVIFGAFDCRFGAMLTHWSATFDVSYTGDAEFRVGLGYELDGAIVEFVPLGGIPDAPGVAGRHVFSGTMLQSIPDKPPGTADQEASAQVAIDVIAGSLQVNEVELQQAGIQLTKRATF